MFHSYGIEYLLNLYSVYAHIPMIALYFLVVRDWSLFK